MIGQVKGVVMPMRSTYAYAVLAAIVVTTGIMCAPLVSSTWFVVISTLALLAALGGGLMRAWSRAVINVAENLLLQHSQPGSMMRQSDEFTRTLNDIILLIREDGTIVNVNDRAAAAYGYSREELE